MEEAHARYGELVVREFDHWLAEEQERPSRSHQPATREAVALGSREQRHLSFKGEEICHMHSPGEDDDDDAENTASCLSAPVILYVFIPNTATRKYFLTEGGLAPPRTADWADGFQPC